MDTTIERNGKNISSDRLALWQEFELRPLAEDEWDDAYAAQEDVQLVTNGFASNGLGLTEAGMLYVAEQRRLNA